MTSFKDLKRHVEAARETLLPHAEGNEEIGAALAELDRSSQAVDWLKARADRWALDMAAQRAFEAFCRHNPNLTVRDAQQNTRSWSKPARSKSTDGRTEAVAGGP